MEYLKAMRFTGGKKLDQGGDTDDKPLPLPADNQFVKSTEVNTAHSESEDENEDDDDFIMDEVKRRLKELRRNSFMELIPEEQSSPEDEEDEEEPGDTSSSESRGAYAERHQFSSGFDAFYGRYSERMLFFDGLIVQQLHEIGSRVPVAFTPKPASKKLASSFRCLSMKKQKDLDDEMEQLRQKPEIHPYHDLDSTYVSHLCLTWEAFHCQYTQFSQQMSCGLQHSASYNHCAQQFQQFQVLLQRFIENEPFEQGSRPETYARMRNSLPKLLQVPKVQGCEQKVIAGETSDFQVLSTDVLSLMESSILTFYQFLRIEKKRSGSGVVQSISGNHGQMSPRLQQVQMSLVKTSMKLKEMRKRRKSWKKNTWPAIQVDVELLLSIIDLKVLSRALKMVRINTEQLIWCEEKMKKIDLSDGKLRRDPSPLLFPSSC